MRLAVINSTGGGISGGYRNYLTNILPHLADNVRVEALLCVSPASLRVQEWLPLNTKIQFAECPPYRPFSRKFVNGLHKSLSLFKPDVIFVPIARPIRYENIPVAAMIQNMSPLVSWKWYGLLEWPRLAAQWLETYRAVRQADRVIAISDFVRQFLVENWGVSPEKVVPVYFGAPSPASTLTRPARIPLDWGNFIFTAGSIEPYRGLEDIIKCAVYSRTKLGQPLRFVLAGSARNSMLAYESRLKTMAEKAGVLADLCWAGQLSYEEMTWCYKNCSAFVMTSRVEAAPNTVLEAMACGSICVAAENAPLPEFFAETAQYYAPGDGEMLAGRIKDVLAWDIPRRDQVSAAAMRRSHKFTWEIAVKETLDVLAGVC